MNEHKKALTEVLTELKANYEKKTFHFLFTKKYEKNIEEVKEAYYDLIDKNKLFTIFIIYSIIIL